MSRRTIYVMIGAIVLLAGRRGMTAEGQEGSQSPQTAPQAGPRIDDVLESLQRTSEQINDVTATFEQIRHTPLLRRPVESRGSIHVNESLMVWETTEPHRSTMAVSEEEVRLYYPDDALLEIYPLSAEYMGMNASPLLRPDQLREHFDIRSVEANATDSDESLLTLHLSPKERNLQRRVALIVLEVDVESAIVRRGELTTPDGERTEFRFADVQLNTGRQIEDVTRNVPRGTQVVRPAADVQDGGDAGT